MKKTKGFLLKYGIFAILISLSLVGGWYAHYYYSVHIEDHSREVLQIRQNSDDGYPLISPLILVADNRNIEFNQYKDLERKIQDYVKDSVKEEKATDVSFYFRDLNGSEWFGINEDDLYAPSSMLKVSILVAYSKLADSNSELLLEKIHYKPSDVSGQFYKPTQLKEGYYTVRDLLSQMIVESDNDAMEALDEFNVDQLLKVYDDLRLPDLSSKDLDFMSSRQYSRVFRALYNGSYISHFYSNQALKLLTATKFDKGIVSGTKDIMVAHKFGELTNLSNGAVTGRQLHDCGIVYYEKKPYFICVMTKGKDFESLEKIISDISKITFDYVEQI